MTVDAAMEQASAFFRAGRHDDAIAMYMRIIESLPQYADARGALALVYWDLNRPAESEAAARAALQIDPECGHALCSLGLNAYNRHDLAEALTLLERGLKTRPDLIAAFNYAGMCCERLGDTDRALAYYEALLRLQPDHVHAHFNRALVWLRLGWYERGWHEYEWRWLTGQVARPVIPRPRWDGANLAGKRILVHTEQGIGDTLQFVRFLPMLKEQGAFVVFACLKQMKPLLLRNAGIDDWLPIDEPTAVNFDLYTPIGSVPGWLGINEQNMPKKVPYVFPEPQRIETWRPKIKALAGYKVGLCWQGSKTFIGDKHRSIPLKHFAPLGRVDGVHLISLQKGFGEEQIAENRGLIAITQLEGLDDEGGAMMDTAAVMQHLDLVITSDTAIAHLAGCMGIPVWVALSTAADWRFLRKRSDNPWYPTMRVFRQKSFGDWDGVFEDIAAALRGRMATSTPEIVVAPPASEPVSVPVAPGELFDKLAILRIKSERIGDAAKLEHVHRELASLESVAAAAYTKTSALSKLQAELKLINESLWDIEDAIRECERRQDFGEAFIKLARAVYQSNDQRAAIKRSISELLGSNIAEVKSYAEY